MRFAIFDSQNVKYGRTIQQFKNAKKVLFLYDKLEGFEIAGYDKKFCPANAKIVNFKDVFVKSDSVPNSVVVRYAWRNWVVGTLYGVNLLPISSFRTDQWDDATQVVN